MYTMNVNTHLEIQIRSVTMVNNNFIQTRSIPQKVYEKINAFLR